MSEDDFNFDEAVTDIANTITDSDSASNDAESTDINQAQEESAELPEETDQVTDDPETKAEGDEQEAEGEEQPSEAATKEPPASWAKETHEVWGKLPPEAQEQILKRETQMLDGLDQYKSGYQYGLALDQALAPFRQDIAAAGVDDVTAVASLLNHHKALTTGTLEQRQQALLQIGIATGIIPKEGQTNEDLERQAHENQLKYYQSIEAQRQQQLQQQRQQAIENEIRAFAEAPENVYFNEVYEDMIPLLQAGHNLQQAYDKAVWANPITRSRELAKEQEKAAVARAAQIKKEAAAAQKAKSANIRTSQTSGKSSEPTGTWDDTMNEVYRRINNG